MSRDSSFGVLPVNMTASTSEKESRSICQEKMNHRVTTSFSEMKDLVGNERDEGLGML
jgi:hypothetical protein